MKANTILQARLVLVGAILVGIIPEFFGLQHLAGEGLKPTEQVPAIVLAVTAIICSTVTYCVAAAYGHRLGYTSKAYPLVERFVNDDLRRKLASRKYRRLNEKLIEREKLPRDIAGQNATTKAIEAEIASVKQASARKLENLEKERVELIHRPIGKEAWPLDQQELHTELEERELELDAELAAQRAAHRSTEDQN